MSKAITLNNNTVAMNVNFDKQLAAVKAVLMGILMPLTSYLLSFGFGVVCSAASGLTHGSYPELFTTAAAIATVIGFAAATMVFRGKQKFLSAQMPAIGIAQGICASLIAG